MVKLKELVEYLNNLVDINSIGRDCSNNGLQVQGKNEVKKIVFSVDASIELIERAEKVNADFIFVHHGISWGSSLKYIAGVNYSRIQPLIKNDISLFAAHLPLDAHPSIGHNALLAEMAELIEKKMYCEYPAVNAEIGVRGTLPNPVSVEALAKMLESKLDQMILNNKKDTNPVLPSNYIMDNSRNQQLKNIGVISGGAGQEGVMGSIEAGIDCLITGEFTHSTYFTARENGLSIIALGHYKSEVPGVIAVMEKVKKEMPDLEVEFIDIPTGL